MAEKVKISRGKRILFYELYPSKSSLEFRNSVQQVHFAYVG